MLIDIELKSIPDAALATGENLMALFISG